MSEKGILFNGPMVRAILDGRKTQTRRVVKPQPPPEFDWNPEASLFVRKGDPFGLIRRAPYSVGDLLYVRETWAPGYDHSAEDGTASIIFRADGAEHVAKAGITTADKWARIFSEDGWDDSRWRPSIHMPKWAARLWLEVTAVRCERLHDISEADAKSEGVISAIAGVIDAYPDPLPLKTFRQGFVSLWQKLSAKPDLTWESNPWVWVFEFRRVER